MTTASRSISDDAMTAVRPEFRHDYQRELTALLRRRFVWLCLAWLGLIFLAVVIQVIVGWAQESLQWYTVAMQPADAFDKIGRVVILAFALALIRRRRLTLAQILNVAHWMIVTAAIVGLLAALISAHGGGAMAARTSVSGIEAAQPVTTVILVVALNHLFVCFFLPWTPRQALRPLYVVYPMWAGVTLLHDGLSYSFIANGLFAAPLINVAGLWISSSRSTRLRDRFQLRTLRRRFRQSRRELIDAREIHERRFPRPISDGPIQLSYAYEPMRQIGGDFLHVHSDPAGGLHLALIDVTGHGIAAALTVNRIDGELKRLYAENPEAPPGEVTRLLNHYVHLTMSRHGIFATGICLRVDLDGVVEYCNAGHPPAFLKRASGEIEQLDSTTFMLGVCPDTAFDAETVRLEISTGDAFIAYTDGACEAADGRGKQLGIKGLSRVINAWRDGSGVDLIPFLPEAVRHWREGPAKDDVLFAALRRSQ